MTITNRRAIAALALLWTTPLAAEPTDDAGDVVVTARRREEDAQAVPVSLSVVAGDLIDKSYTINTQGLTTLIPSLNYSSANPRNTAFTIRGLGSSVVAVSQANDGLEPGVGFYVDQVYHARPATAAFDFADVAQVERMRGPQGTLFGKNPTTSAINVTSRAPSFTREGYAELSYGDHDFVQARGWASAHHRYRRLPPVGRVDAARRRHPQREDGREADTLGQQAVRGQLLFQPDDAIRMRLIADFANFQSYCCGQVPVRVATSRRNAGRQYPALARLFAYAPPSFDYRDRLTDIDGPLGVDTNEGGVNAITDWNLGPVTLTSVSAWRFWNWDARTTTIPASRSSCRNTFRHDRTSTARNSASPLTATVRSAAM
ncbi:TonB-dependent receptor plug domain-containing protein [Sphingomonas sp. MMS24-JH45]